MKLLKYLLFWCIVTLSMTGSFLFLQKRMSSTVAILSPLAADASLGGGEVKAEQSVEMSEGLEKAVTDALLGTFGNYAVVIKHLETGESYLRFEDKTFQTASLYKLWLMSAAFEQIQNGTLEKEQRITAEVEKLNKTFKISSDAAELKEGVVSLTVQQAIEKSITISDNYAALLLASKVKTSSMQKFLTKYGLSHSKVGSPPKTTAFDIARFYEKLHNGEIITPSNSNEMLTILKKQALNDRIPKYIPKYVEIAHKTGELDRVKHDAGIVYSPKGAYIIVILSESDNPYQAAERIALVSKNVFEYFQNNASLTRGE